MKKHPVDDLFKRRLADLNKKPSENAWLRIQENTGARRRPVIWPWYVAASLTLALIAGYVVWENSQNELVESAGLQRNAASVKKLDDPKPVEKNHPDDRRVDATPIAALSGTGKKNADKTEPRSEPTPVRSQESRPREAEAPAGVEDVEVVSNTVATIDPPKSPEMASLMPSAGTNDLPGVVKEKSEPAVTIVVAVESDESETEERPRASRLSRVFRQLKNARSGEKVDWEEVGFNPKNLVARVDDRLRGKEEKTSERGQNSKEKTKF
jgi:hypothetical protein